MDQHKSGAPFGLGSYRMGWPVSSVSALWSLLEGCGSLPGHRAV